MYHGDLFGTIIFCIAITLFDIRHFCECCNSQFKGNMKNRFVRKTSLVLEPLKNIDIKLMTKENQNTKSNYVLIQRNSGKETVTTRQGIKLVIGTLKCISHADLQLIRVQCRHKSLTLNYGPLNVNHLTI